MTILSHHYITNLPANLYFSFIEQLEHYRKVPGEERLEAANRGGAFS